MDEKMMWGLAVIGMVCLYGVLLCLVGGWLEWLEGDRELEVCGWDDRQRGPERKWADHA